MKRLALPLLLPVLVLAACASDDAGGGSSSRGSDRGDAPSGAPTVQTFPPETQAFMKAALKQFSDQSPNWESSRREWLAMGDREAQFLVQTMWGGLLNAQQRNAPDLVERARHELALIGEPSIPLMAEVIATGEAGTLRDPATGEDRPIRIDDLQRREAAEVLSIIGAPALPATLEALDRSETKSGRRYALVTIGNIGARGGDTVSRALVEWARAEDVLHRLEAVNGMRNCRDDATRSALFAALSDEEEIVRVRAAESLYGRKDGSAAGAVQAAADRAKGEGRLVEARKLERIASALGRLPRG